MNIDYALAPHEVVERDWWAAHPNGTEAEFEAFLIGVKNMDSKIYQVTLTRLSGEDSLVGNYLDTDAENVISRVGILLGLTFTMVSPHVAECGELVIAAFPYDDEN